jgi:hypothetical protein
MSETPDREEFQSFVAKIATERRLPSVDWDPASIGRSGIITGDDLLVESWIVAEQSDRAVTDLESDEIAAIAWGIARSSGGQPGTSNISAEQWASVGDGTDFSAGLPESSAKSAREVRLPNVLERISRTRCLVPNDALTDSQISALLTPDFVRTTSSVRRTSRPAACRLRQRAERNVRRLVRIDDFLFGDWKRWLELEAKTWRADFVRAEIWPLIKPSPAAAHVRKLLHPRQRELFEFGMHLLLDQLPRHFPSSDAIAIGYHACVIAAYIDPESARGAVDDLRRAVAKGELLYRRIADRCAHLCADAAARNEYLRGLKTYIEETPAEGVFFARYATVYYGGTTDEQAKRFLSGDLVPESAFVNPDLVIYETWKNLSEHQYRECTTLDDINFARCILVVKVLGFLNRVSRKSLRLLRVLAQHSRKSPTAWIASLAELTLKEVEHRLGLHGVTTDRHRRRPR